MKVIWVCFLEINIFVM